MRHALPTLLTTALTTLLFPLFGPPTARAEAPPGDAEPTADARPWRLDLHAELGSLWVAYHTVKLDRDGTDIDYIDDLGQENLVPFLRGSVDLYLGQEQRHIITLLYQPLEIVSARNLARDLVIDDQVFPEGAAVRSTYSFPFARISYLYDFADGPDELGIGLSVQLRNATLEFEQLDGPAFRSRRDIGPVPVLKFRWKQGFANGAFAGFEIDGFYAPIRYLNGGETDVEGAIVDASLRAGLELDQDVSAFLNLRWLGGGATGSGDDDDNPGDNYNANWLTFFSLSLGLTYSGL